MGLLIAIAIVALIVGSSFIVFKGDKPSTSKELPLLPIELGSVYLDRLDREWTIVDEYAMSEALFIKRYSVKAKRDGKVFMFTENGILNTNYKSDKDLVKRIK